MQANVFLQRNKLSLRRCCEVTIIATDKKRHLSQHLHRSLSWRGILPHSLPNLNFKLSEEGFKINTLSNIFNNSVNTLPKELLKLYDLITSVSALLL